MPIGERLKERRRSIHISQECLGEKAGVHANTIRKWEKGQRSPRAEELPALAAALNTSVAYLTGETDNPAPPGALQAVVELTKYGGIAPSVPQDEQKRQATLEGMAHTVAEEIGESASPSVRYSDVVWVPVVSSNVKACCGDGNGYPEEVTWEEEGKYPILASELVGYSWQLRDGGYHIIPVEGDSMEPKVHSGDRILIADIEIGDSDLALCLYKGRLLLRGVTFEKDKIRLHAWNKDYEDIVVPMDNIDDLFFLGRMIGIVPPLQRLSSMW